MKAERAVPILIWLFSCGGRAGSAPSPQEPAAPTASAPAQAPSAPMASEASSLEKGEPAAESASGPRPPMSDKPTPTVQPGAAAMPIPAARLEIPPHAGVEAAIRSVPQGAPRIAMSEEALKAPLLELKRYERCKIPRSTKVHLRVAVYDGAAAGIDVTTKPKSSRIDQCIEEVVRGMSWDKIPSLNSVTVNF